MMSELPSESWVAQMRAFLHGVCFFQLSQRASLTLLEEAAAPGSEWAFHLASPLEFRCSVSSLACRRWVLALPLAFLKAPQDLPEPIPELALTAARRAQDQCTGSIGPFVYRRTSTALSASP